MDCNDLNVKKIGICRGYSQNESKLSQDEDKREEFAGALKGYKTDKGTIRIPYGNVDAELIKRIALWCYETGNHA